MICVLRGCHSIFKSNMSSFLPYGMKYLPCGPKVFCLFSTAVMNATTKNALGGKGLFHLIVYSSF